MAIPKQNVCTHEMIKGYLSWLKMYYDGLDEWNLLGGPGLEVEDCLEAVLVDLLGGVMDFKIVGGFGDWVDFGTRERERLEEGQGR